MFSYERRRGTLTVALCGELDHGFARHARGEVDELLRDPGIERLVLDLNGLSFMDSSGIGFIIGRYKLLSRRGGSVAVTGVGVDVDRMLRLSGLYQIVEKLA